MEKRHMLYVTIYSSALSPCGKFLAVGNNYGFISIFNIADALSSAACDTDKKPICEFKAHPGAVHSLLSTAKYLVSAGYGPIMGWKWSDLISNRTTKSLSLCKEKETVSNLTNVPDCESYNCLAYNSKNQLLFSGGDDNVTTVWDLNAEKATDTLTGHTAYIHDVKLDFSGNSLVSASEDGCVKVWDARSNYCTSTIEPHKRSELSRPALGKWISCAAVDSNGQWMTCGGGPRTSLWHLRSGNLISALSDETSPGDSRELSANCITFLNGEIIAGGNQPNIHRWHVNGQSKTVVPCTIKNIFSLSYKTASNSSDQELPLIITGTSPKINIFTNLGYLGTSLSLI